MAANYGALKSDVASWLNRVDLTASIPTFIAGALARINLELQVAGGIVDQQQIAYATTTANVDSLTVPSDYQSLRYIKITDSSGLTDVLETVTYDQLIDTYGDLVKGIPEQVAIFDGSFIFRPIPDGVYTVQIGYLKKYADFNLDSDTNWLLQNGGNLMLYAACLEAAPKLDDDARLSTWVSAYQRSMDLVISANRRSQRGPKPAGVRMEPYLLGSRGSSILYGP